ncbi:MAG: hypothetical protein HPY60_10940 [Candidatus Methanofastidiosum sp.]|nr:hypothetical protein [Methanofastidiosum sp.]
MVERGTRHTILTVEKNLSKELILSIIETHCKGSIIAFTDDYTIYTNLEEHLDVKEHYVINHSQKEYANNEKHVNTSENRHSLLRQYLRIFRGVSKNISPYVRQILPIYIYPWS